MGRSQPIKRSPDGSGSETSSGIFRHIRTYPDISGHIRTCHDRRVRKEPVPDRVSYGQSRAKGAGTGSRAVKSVACERSRCRIAYPMVGRVRKEPVPDRVPYGRSRAVSPVAGSRAVWPVAGSRLGVSLLVSATSMSLPCSRSGEPKARRLAMSRPNSACSRRRHQRFTNIYSFTWPWRSITVQSAARLRRALGRSS